MSVFSLFKKQVEAAKVRILSLNHHIQVHFRLIEGSLARDRFRGVIWH